MGLERELQVGLGKLLAAASDTARLGFTLSHDLIPERRYRTCHELILLDILVYDLDLVRLVRSSDDQMY